MAMQAVVDPARRRRWVEQPEPDELVVLVRHRQSVSFLEERRGKHAVHVFDGARRIMPAVGFCYRFPTRTLPVYRHPSLPEAKADSHSRRRRK